MAFLQQLPPQLRSLQLEGEASHRCTPTASSFQASASLLPEINRNPLEIFKGSLCLKFYDGCSRQAAPASCCRASSASHAQANLKLILCGPQA